jgi:hypothetical protein
MNETFWFGLIVGGLIVVAIAVRLSSRLRHERALARVEAKLDALLKHEGIRFDPYADLPPAVADALQRGRKIEAIKEYRLATGVGLKDAKEYVEEVERRGIPRV